MTQTSNAKESYGGTACSKAHTQTGDPDVAVYEITSSNEICIYTVGSGERKSELASVVMTLRCFLFGRDLSVIDKHFAVY